MYLKLILICLLIIIVNSVLETSACEGCVLITDKNFSKLLPRFKYLLVKFDKERDTRDYYEIFSRLALEQQSVDDILFGALYVQYYFKNRNEKFALSYNVTRSDYPTIYLFRGGDAGDPVPYPKDQDFTLVNLRRFLNEHTDVVLNEPGRLEELEVLANQFIRADNREEILDRANEFVNNLPDLDQKFGSLYIEVMERIMKEGHDFIPGETDMMIVSMMQGTEHSEEYMKKLHVFGGFPIPKKN